MLSALGVFDPKKVPSFSTHELPLYGDSSIQTLIGQFGRNLPAQSLEGIEFEKAAVVYSVILAQSRKLIISSLLSSQKMIYPCN